MRSIVRLGVGSAFQLARAIGAPIIPQANSSLNEAVNNSDVVPFQPAIPTAGMEFADDYNYQTDSNGCKLQYLAIGVGGHFGVTNATHGVPTTQTKPHRARHTGLFRQIPFVCKPLDDDLSLEDRAKYRLRKVVEINGVKYAAYFLRYIDLSASSIVQVIVKKVNGVKQATPYSPTINDLVPQDPVISGTNDGTYLQTYIQTDITFDSKEAAWLREVAALWFGDENAAIVSEIAVCSGVDKPITKRYPASGNQTAISVNSGLKEALAVQATIVESTHFAMTFVNGSVSEKIYIGTEDPLYGSNFTGG